MKLKTSENCLLWLDSLDSLSFDDKQFIIRYFDEYVNLLDKLFEYQDNLDNYLSQGAKDFLFSKDGRRSYNDIDKLVKETKTEYVTIASKDYPQILREMEYPPIVLYYSGNINLVDTNKVSINGTRTNTQYGRSVTEHLVKALIDNDITIVSGISDGIDQIAVETTLENAGSNIVVLAGGFDKVVPSVNQQLVESVERTGLVISECRHGVVPRKYHYSMRNRLLAQLSDVAVLIESKIDSNCVGVINWAFGNGKETYAVPGNLTSPQSKGTNMLIAEEKAKCLIAPRQIVEVFTSEYVFVPMNNKVAQSDELDKKIIDAISKGFKHIDDIEKFSGLTQGQLMTKLLLLESAKIIKRIGGNQYDLVLTVEE